MPSEIVLTNDKHYNDIASAIRNKNGLSTLYKPSEMAEAINALVVGGSVILQDKTINPTESTQVITHDSGYMGLGEVTVTPILTETKTVTENGNVFPTSGKYLTRVTVNVPQGAEINNQDKTVTPSETTQSISYDEGYTGLGTVTVGAISNTYVGSGITRRDDSDLTASGATVTVPSGYYESQETKSIASGSAGTPSATKGTVSNHSISITPSVTNTTGYIIGGTKNGTAVSVSASELVSGTLDITSNGTKNVTNYASVNVQVPTGSTINNQNKSVNPTESEQEVTYDSGYTGLGTVTVGAISSTYIGSGISQRDSTDLTTSGATVTVPAGYYASQATKSITSGTATAPTSISGTTATVSTGTNTLTLTKTVSVTPRITTAGYISSGTAGNASVSLTANVTTKARATITPGTSNQTIASGTYLTGTQTIAGDSDLVAGNIKSGVQIFGVTGTYSGSGTTLQAKSTNPTESEQEITPDSGYDGLSKVTVGAISSTYIGSEINQRDETDLAVSGATVTVPAGYYAEQETKTIDSGALNSNITYNSTRPSLMNAIATVNPNGYVDSSKNISRQIVIADVLPTQGTITITPTESEQTAVSQYKWTTGDVKVGAISSTYIGSGITQRDGDDLTVSGATVSVPAGYYEEDASTSVANGSATNSGTASASSATVTTGTNTITLSKAVSITPTVTAGYINSGTAGNVTISLTGSVTTNPTPTASGKTVTIPAGYYTSQTTKDVTEVTLPTSASSTSSGTSKATISRSTSAQYINIPTGYNSTASYYTISATPNGSATSPASISGTAATVSTGTNTLTLTKTVSVTPTVSAGYVSSGTAGNSSVSLTASVTTQGTRTITPTTSNQTIASGTYITGTQTIAGDANLVASNIISTASIFGVQGSVVINKYYTGSTAPSSSLGNNGDIYIQR